ncbi:MAG: hypothetical protein FJ276_26095, partial [Planctomycetes bacterium]|nr:hypothetical protein [Planctomycetota bacterium]
MSIAVEFSNMPKLRAFVRRTAHPQTLYRWQDDDCVLIRKLDARERRELRRGATAITAAWVWLPHVDPKDPSICSIRDRLELRQQAACPALNDALFRRMNLEEVLRSSQLTKAAMARHRSRQDMVLALFGVTHAGASESYATAPKDESLETKVHFLAPHSDREPSVLVELGQCDASVQWGMWLEAENRRLAANGGGRARLFARVFAGDVDCYVEYRHQHPFGQEVGHLWPNRQRAHILLVDAAFDATEDQPADAVWYPITAEHDVVERADTDNDAVKLFIDLSGQNVHVLPVSEVAQTEPLRVRPRIEPMYGRRGGRLENLNQRIQGVKSTLSRLEHQRATLLDHHRHVLRLALRFCQ